MAGNILVILFAVILNCAAQLLMRKGMLQVGGLSVTQVFTHLMTLAGNIWLWMAVICYVVSMLTWLAVLSKVEVSFAYPFLSIGYVLAAVGSYAFLGEHLGPTRIAGILVICIGVILISRS